MCRTAQVLIAVLLACSVQAEESDGALIEEEWKCFSISDYDQRSVLIELVRFKPITEIFGDSADGESLALGKVVAAGRTNNAYFAVDGLDRTWSWPVGGERITYSIVVEPDGDARYYDFGGVADDESTIASQVYDCVMSKP